MSRTLQLLLLLLLGGLVRADASVRPYKNVTDGPHSCGGVDIPYPFGIGDGNYREGFEVVCDDGKPGQPTDNSPFQIIDFSIQTAEVRFWMPVAWQCYDDSSSVSDYHIVSLQINKEGVHRISNTRNNLFVLGCNTLGYLGSKPDENNTYYAQYTGCFSYCFNSQSAVNGSCSGGGCCHADIPSDLVDNYVIFGNTNHSYVVDFSPCDYVFVAEKENFTFDTTDLKRNLTRTPWPMPVVLDWAIRRDNLTCKEAKKKKDYACISSNSRCLNATNGPGYICKCRKGYEGNPYSSGDNGCTDINECERLGHHYHCKGECMNKQGYYECTCPKGTHSDDTYNEECVPNFSSTIKIIIGAVGGIFIIVIMVFYWLLMEERRKVNEYFVKNGGPALEKLNNIKLFTKEEIRKIRKNDNVIGSGGFGKVYKGHIEDINQPVAVKEPIKGNSADKDQFVNEISIQSRVIHKNIVKLLGCCLEFDVPILVYEFVPKGSLDDILHGDRRMPLSFGHRLQIAAESAEGLAYMHSKTTTTILHGDVKPANILLSDDYIPKISDFGISRLIAADKQHTGHVIGDMKYMDPVFLQTGLLTNKSDVYSFGVVLLELITRKKASRSDKNNLLKNFLEAYTKDKCVIQLIDKELAQVDPDLLDSLSGMINECLNLDVSQRPEMTDVAERLREMVKRYDSK